LVGKPEGMKLLERPRRRWEDNIRMVPRHMWWEIVDWTHLKQGRDQWLALVNMVKSLWIL